MSLLLGNWPFSELVHRPYSLAATVDWWLPGGRRWWGYLTIPITHRATMSPATSDDAVNQVVATDMFSRMFNKGCFLAQVQHT